MKNISLLFGLFMLLLLAGCDDEYKPLNDYSDVQWYTDLSHERPNAVGLNKYLSFADLSQNALSHEWELEQGAGTYFLKGNIRYSDTVYTQYIDPNATNVTTDETVSVLFTKPGLQKLRLYNTFKEFVQYIGNDTLDAVKKGDVWVIDTTFVLDVYDTLQPAVKLFHNDVEILDLPANTIVNEADSASWPLYEIEAGESIKFVDMTTIDRPTGRHWVVPTGSGNASDSAANFAFYRLGVVKTAIQSQRNGEHIPFGYKQQLIPIRIKVNKSSLPLKLASDVYELENETIQLPLTGEIEPFFGKEGEFTVHVTNPNGFDQDMTIKSVSVNAKQGNLIDIQLVDPIYNTDAITVSYSGTDIVSLDERTLESFTDMPVSMYMPNLIPNHSFENAGAQWKLGEDHNPESIAEFVTGDATDGEYAYHTHRTADSGRTSIWSAPFTLTQGLKYKFVWDIKTVQSGGYWNGYEIRIAKESFFDTGGGENTGPVIKMWKPQKDADNTWRTETDVKSLGAPSGDDYILHLITYMPNAELYFDNFKVYVYEERP